MYWDNDECGNYDACIHLPFTEREDKNKWEYKQLINKQIENVN